MVNTLPVAGIDAGLRELLALLVTEGPTTRSQLVAQTGLSRTTLSARVDALRAAGLVTDAGGSSSTGGRPSIQLGFDVRAGAVAAIDIGTTHCTTAVAHLDGRPLSRNRSQSSLLDGPEAVLTAAADAIEQQLAELGIPQSGLRAVTVGIPAPIAPETRRVNNIGPMPGWSTFNIVGWLEERLHATVLVENDVNLMALGERSASDPLIDDLLFLKVAGGIGVGLVLGGVLERGARGLAGDIGHIPAPGGVAVQCACGNQGCLEAIATTRAIRESLSAAGVETADAADIADRVEQGDVVTAQTLRRAGRHLGDVLATCIALTNPSRVVVGGSLAFAGDHLIAGIKERIFAQLVPPLTDGLLITRARADHDAGVTGALALARDAALSPAGIAELVDGIGM